MDETEKPAAGCVCQGIGPRDNDGPDDDDDDDGGDDDEWSAVMRIEVEARTRARTRIVSESDRGVGPNG